MSSASPYDGGAEACGGGAVGGDSGILYCIPGEGSLPPTVVYVTWGDLCGWTPLSTGLIGVPL